MRGRKRLPPGVARRRVAFVLSDAEHEWVKGRGMSVSSYVSGLVREDMEAAGGIDPAPSLARWRVIPEGGKRWHAFAFLGGGEFTWACRHVSISGYLSGLVRKDMEGGDGQCQRY